MAAVVLVLVAVAAWQLLARSTLAEISVTPASMQCDGKDVPATVVPDEFGDAPAPTFQPELTPASDCWITVTVSNHGSRPVHLSSVTFDAMMPGESGRFLLETPRDEFDQRPHEVDESGDAIFDADETIDAGTWTLLTYRIAYRADGASCPGGASQSQDLPTARVSTLHVPRDVRGSVKIVHDTVPTKGNRTCD
ncbi:hypothetical protein ASD10_14910 [Aeromicrobium sp. Root472D3]|nr:hypothetical protein ASD10_14910 [Aeromicrobium sp. Root472D3]